MNNILGLIFFSVIIFSSCSLSKQSVNYKACDCCKQTYTNISTAVNCIANHPKTNILSDDRLLLIAFVKENLKIEQNKGWNLIEDSDIVKAAKQKYLLVIIDVNDVEIQNTYNSPELINVIQSHQENLFFVIANQALYPLSDWTLAENKDLIIDRLLVGNGP